MEKIRTHLTVLAADVYARLEGRLGPLDERGGGRNSDEGFHIGGGAVIAGVIAAAVGAFVAKKLGALN
ncbi:MAG: hypothetical protein J0I49_08495 [Pseudonocardia sp.]|uniref:hypothetical protein n=1 Tax=Pseudonocardia sp. TaxID=60912 RepID=UPI001AC8D596|nr:hypothetical protein [Pseudonocardia sp.]MBN9098133.1 hypothetical protein [Pseudonocardia sp.]